jgi:hypothetical protein
MTIATVFKCLGLRRWLVGRRFRRNRARLALLSLEEEHLSEFGLQVQGSLRRELRDRVRRHRRPR